jgi:hypothetical protein
MGKGGNSAINAQNSRCPTAQVKNKRQFFQIFNIMHTVQLHDGGRESNLYSVQQCFSQLNIFKK